MLLIFKIFFLVLFCDVCEVSFKEWTNRPYLLAERPNDNQTSSVLYLPVLFSESLAMTIVP